MSKPAGTTHNPQPPLGQPHSLTLGALPRCRAARLLPPTKKNKREMFKFSRLRWPLAAAIVLDQAFPEMFLEGIDAKGLPVDEQFMETIA